MGAQMRSWNFLRSTKDSTESQKVGVAFIQAFLAVQCFFALTKYLSREPKPNEKNLALRQKCLDIDRKNAQTRFLSKCRHEYEETCEDVADLEDMSIWTDEQKQALENLYIKNGKDSIQNYFQEREDRLARIDKIYNQYLPTTRYESALKFHKKMPGAELFY